MCGWVAASGKVSASWHAHLNGKTAGLILRFPNTLTVHSGDDGGHEQPHKVCSQGLQARENTSAGADGSGAHFLPACTADPQARNT